MILTYPPSLVIQRCGRVYRWVSGLPHPRHAVQKPHWHLHLHLPAWHAAPALWGGLHRYVVLPGHRESYMEGRVQSERGTFKAKGNWLGGFGLPLWPASSLPSQMRTNARPSPASVPTAAASTQWEASGVIVMRASIPAPPSLSAMVSVTRNKQGEQRLGRSEARMRSGKLRRPEGNRCTIINVDT